LIRHRVTVAITFIAAACLITVAGLWIWLGSDSGRQWLASTVASASHGSIEIRGLSGHPLSQTGAETVLFTGNGVEMTSGPVVLVWSPWRLFSGELAIASLKADRVSVRITASSQAEPDAPANVPAFSVRLDLMHVGELIVDREGSTQTRISDISLTGLRLGKTLAGDLQAQLPDGDLNVQLAGQLESWKANGIVQSKAKGKLGFSLSGQYLNSGEAKLDVESASGDGRLEALWQRGKETLTAGGKLRLHADSGEMAGDWKLNAPLHASGNTPSRAELSLHAAASSAALLERAIPLDITAIWEEGILSAVVDEQGHGLRLALTYTDAQLQGDLTLVEWNSPLKNADGRLSGRLHGTWQPDTQQWRLQGDIDKGELAGLTASMKVDGEGDAAVWHVRRADIHALGLNVKLAGQGDRARFNLAGSLEGKNIAPALKLAGIKQAAGRLQADIRLAGSYDAPQVNVTAKIRAMKLESAAIDSASLSVRHNSGNGSYHLVATSVSIDGRREMDQLEITARLKAGQLTLNLASEGKLQSRAKLTTGLEDPEHTAIVLTGVRVNYAKSSLLEAGRLALRIDGKHIRLPESGILLLGAKGSCAFDFSPERVSGKLDIADFNISGNESWLTGLPYHFAGHTGIKLSLAGHPQSPTAMLNITSPGVQIKHPMFTGEGGRSLKLSNASLTLNYNRQLLNWQLQAAAPAQGLLESSGHLTMLFAVQPWQLALPERQDGAGSLKIRFASLADMQPLLPRIDPLEGSSDLDLSWSMPLSIHSVKGAARISLDAIGIPEFGLEMKGALEATLAAGKPFVDLHLHSGEGELVMNGPLDIDNRTVPDLHFNRFPLMQLPDQQLVVSGTIAASEQQKVSIIGGELEVVHLRLEIPDQVPGPTADLQWESDPLAAADKKKRTPLSKVDVDLILSGDSEIYGRGMSLKPKGKLHLGGSVTQPNLTGVLEIASGKIEFRSVKLDIQPDSRVVFSGDPKRPSIHIIAARKIGDITAGVIVDGPADQLNSQLFSKPAMSNAEIFSYIATGRALASLGQESASDMMTAAEFILGPGTMMQEVQGKVKQTTGLDVFEVGGDASGGKIRAGRKLSDKVTLTVDQTVSKEASTALTLQYMLTRSLSIFARQTVNLPPMIGLRYSKEWFGAPQPKHEK